MDLTGKEKSKNGNKEEIGKTKGNNGGRDKQGLVETTEENKYKGGHKQGGEIKKGNADDRGDKKKVEFENKKAGDGGKKSKYEDNTHLSFSLGLSEDSDQTSSKNSNDEHQRVVIRLSNKKVLNPNPIFVAIPTEEGPSNHDLDESRPKKLVDPFKSP
ncbi:unnamed protein product [Lactuca saligna]|uniref:Uncharacterized protein n=1 Tax=Lactuca saligna TaxID=75948 RepID=A0AA36EB01_LACSI|nr:unnamed protein product [Lactuca saligna]